MTGKTEMIFKVTSTVPDAHSYINHDGFNNTTYLNKVRYSNSN